MATYYKPCLRPNQKQPLVNLKTAYNTQSMHETIDHILNENEQLKARVSELENRLKKTEKKKLVKRDDAIISLDKKKKFTFWEKSKNQNLRAESMTEYELVKKAVAATGHTQEIYQKNALIKQSISDLALLMSDRSINAMENVRKIYETMVKEGVRITPGGLQKYAAANEITVRRFLAINEIEL